MVIPFGPTFAIHCPSEVPYSDYFILFLQCGPNPISNLFESTVDYWRTILAAERCTSYHFLQIGTLALLDTDWITVDLVHFTALDGFLSVAEGRC